MGLDPDDLASCVACGLCLPHCPTFRVSGEEALSPRGRIAVMRAIDDGEPPDPSAARALDTCVQCRGCETACPSGVPFERLLSGTRAALLGRGQLEAPWWERAGLAGLRHHRVLLAGSALVGAAQRLGLPLPGRAALPRSVPVRQPRLRSSGSDVWLHTGCVMDAWQRHVHLAVQRVVEATGRGVAFAGGGAACCGALSHHAGRVDEARAYARRTMAAFPGSAPILVDSAGCGAALKDYGHLLGTPDAATFAGRVVDVHEWLAPRLAELPPVRGVITARVAIQDPCHLRHAQRVHGAVREVLAPVVDDLVELDDEGMCCGAGGAYSLVQPELAAEIRDRKVGAVLRSGATVLASANPGCTVHLANAPALQRVHVVHPMQLVARALGD